MPEPAIVAELAEAREPEEAQLGLF
jgi:hypothetical protein